MLRRVRWIFNSFKT